MFTPAEYRSRNGSVSADEVEEVKKSVAMLELVLRSDWQTIGALLDDEEFKKSLRGPLLKIVGWDEQNETAVVAHAAALKEEKTVAARKERFLKTFGLFKKLAKGAVVLGAAAVLATVAINAVTVGKNDKNKK